MVLHCGLTFHKQRDNRSRADRSSVSRLWRNRSVGTHGLLGRVGALYTQGHL